MKNSPTRPSARILACTITALLAMQSVHGASATWTGTTDGVWATGTNWSTTPVPGTDDTATFNSGGGAVDVINLGSGVTINTILFAAGAEAYTIGSAANQTLTLNDSGAVTLNAGVLFDQLFNDGLTLGTTGFYTVTNNSATNP